MNQIKTGALISYASLFLNIVTGLLYTPWMISTIGKGNYGLYTLAMSVISLFVFDFGLGSAITRFVSKFLAEGRQYMVDKLLGLTFKLYLLGDLLILVSLTVIYFFLPSMYRGLTPDELESFKIVYIIASMFCVISFPFLPLNGVLTSYEKFIQLKSCDFAHKLIVVILMTICLLIGTGVYALVAINSFASILMIIFKLYVLGGKRISAIDWKYWDKQLLRSVFSFSVWVTIIQLSQRCVFNIAPSILAYTTNSTAVTMLGIAICLEGYTYTFAGAINGMFLPRVSRLLERNDRGEILNLMIRVGRIQIYIIGLICVGFVCIGREFILCWMGEGFEDVYPCALMLILPSFLQLPQEIGSNTVIAEGKVKYQAYAFIIMAALNLILAFPLSILYGVKGLCLSIMFAYMIRTAIMDYIFYKHIHLNVVIFFKESYCKILPSIILSSIITIIVLQFTNLDSWIGLITKSIVCAAIYIFCIVLLAFNKEEKDLFISPIRKLYNS